VIAGLGAAVVTIVADLHDLGVCHRAIDAAHVLVDRDGRPVLCSFGRAARHADAGAAPGCGVDDVRALAGLLLDHLAGGASGRLGRTLRRAAGSGRSRRGSDARWLARQLAFSVPGARLVDPAMSGDAAQVGRRSTSEVPEPGPSQLVRWWPPPGWAAMAGGALALTLVVAGLLMTSSTVAGSRSVCPAVDDRCGPIPTPGGIVSTAFGRYSVARPGDVVVVGRWHCAGTALPALLRPSTGQLWAFDAWPGAGRAVVGRPVGRDLVSAWSLRVVPQRAGCDAVEVERRGRPPVTIGVGR
jgi:hypothetical protein